MHVFHLQMCNRSLRFDAPLTESQQMGLVCAVLGLDAVLGGMTMSSMRSHELEHTAELPKVQECGCGAHEGQDETDFYESSHILLILRRGSRRRQAGGN